MPWHVATLKGCKKCRGGGKKTKKGEGEDEDEIFMAHASLFTIFGSEIARFCTS